jgi:hypothetical protein
MHHHLDDEEERWREIAGVETEDALAPGTRRRNSFARILQTVEMGVPAAVRALPTQLLAKAKGLSGGGAGAGAGGGDGLLSTTPPRSRRVPSPGSPHDYSAFLSSDIDDEPKVCVHVACRWWL